MLYDLDNFLKTSDATSHDVTLIYYNIEKAEIGWFNLSNEGLSNTNSFRTIVPQLRLCAKLNELPSYISTMGKLVWHTVFAMFLFTSNKD